MFRKTILGLAAGAALVTAALAPTAASADYYGRLRLSSRTTSRTTAKLRLPFLLQAVLRLSLVLPLLLSTPRLMAPC